MSLKRPATSEGEGSSVLKLPRSSWYYVLQSESDQPTDEDSESVNSIQGKETDYAKDTSDTSTQSDSSDGVTMEVEYEVASLSERENPLGDGSLSSDTDDLMYASMVVLCKEELSVFADSSETSESQHDPEVPRADYWTCVQCKNKNNNPLFRYCEKCYKVRKNFFPPRPRKRRRKRRTSKKAVSDTFRTVGPVHMDSGLGSSQESCYQIESKCETDSPASVPSSGYSDVCITCLQNTKNGIFVHGKVGHICCCYGCALKVWTENRRCPLCNCKVSNVLKAIVQ